ncbi:MAG: hypothetical protein GX147_10720 [Deltaproteobacteria bacterium]|nr:hypothetical protein [Deltaproteobacteria bacterium]
MINKIGLFLFIASVTVFFLAACQTTQKTGNMESLVPPTKAESSQETQKATPADTRQNAQTVKGINDWEGEIIGKPAKDSKFTKLKIGMTIKQVTKLIGQPNDQGTYVTGKAWIPFYRGSDVYRHELVYQNQGRLIFASDPSGDYDSGNLITIIHNAQESGHR